MFSRFSFEDISKSVVLRRIFNKRKLFKWKPSDILLNSETSAISNIFLLSSVITKFIHKSLPQKTGALPKHSFYNDRFKLVKVRHVHLELEPLLQFREDLLQITSWKWIHLAQSPKSTPKKILPKKFLHLPKITNFLRSKKISNTFQKKKFTLFRKKQIFQTKIIYYNYRNKQFFKHRISYACLKN